MADLGRGGSLSLSTPTPPYSCFVGSGLIAGEDLDAVTPCYIDASDGLVYASDGSASDALAQVDGWTPRSAEEGEAVTLMVDVDFDYDDGGVTPGAKYYVSTNAGLLSDSSTTGGTAWVAKGIDDRRIRVRASTY